MKITEQNIIDCAVKIKHNTDDNQLTNILDELIRNGDCMEWDDIYQVIKRIYEDGYDISHVCLYEIPHASVFIFYDKAVEKMFDVYTDHFNGGRDFVSVGYVGKDSCTHDAENIQAALYSL